MDPNTAAQMAVWRQRDDKENGEIFSNIWDSELREIKATIAVDSMKASQYQLVY